jgi:hypothetical protein
LIEGVVLLILLKGVSALMLKPMSDLFEVFGVRICGLGEKVFGAALPVLLP